jgi:hypothetical protein
LNISILALGIMKSLVFRKSYRKLSGGLLIKTLRKDFGQYWYLIECMNVSLD